MPAKPGRLTGGGVLDEETDHMAERGAPLGDTGQPPQRGLLHHLGTGEAVECKVVLLLEELLGTRGEACTGRDGNLGCQEEACGTCTSLPCRERTPIGLGWFFPPFPLGYCPRLGSTVERGRLPGAGGKPTGLTGLPAKVWGSGLLRVRGQRTYEAGELTEAPGHVHGQDRAVALLQGDVAQVVGEAAQPLGDAGIAEVQQHVEAQGLQGREVQLPVGIIKLDAGGVLLVLGQAQHLQVVVAHEVLRFVRLALQPRLGHGEPGREEGSVSWGEGTPFPESLLPCVLVPSLPETPSPCPCWGSAASGSSAQRWQREEDTQGREGAASLLSSEGCDQKGLAPTSHHPQDPEGSPSPALEEASGGRPARPSTKAWEQRPPHLCLGLHPRGTGCPPWPLQWGRPGPPAAAPRAALTLPVSSSPPSVSRLKLTLEPDGCLLRPWAL